MINTINTIITNCIHCRWADKLTISYLAKVLRENIFSGWDIVQISCWCCCVFFFLPSYLFLPLIFLLLLLLLFLVCVSVYVCVLVCVWWQIFCFLSSRFSGSLLTEDFEPTIASNDVNVAVAAFIAPFVSYEFHTFFPTTTLIKLASPVASTFLSHTHSLLCLLS